MKKIPNFRKTIRHMHLMVDGYLGKFFSKQGTLSEISEKPHARLNPHVFSKFSFSQKWHFQKFNLLPFHLNQSPATCDLKVYQDLLVYTFILDNIQPGSRILEIGGGESRIVNEIKENYDIWNLDKLEGAGFGPTDLLENKGFHLVKDYIGNFSNELPDEGFDLIFSISTIEHFPRDPENIKTIIGDMQRLLKPGGFSLHCVDALLFDDHYFVHPVVEMIHKMKKPDYPLVTFQEIKKNNEVWLLPAFAFYTRWYHLVNKPLRLFGHPFSINVLWQKDTG